MPATILLCDPSRDQREMYAESLRHAGFDVVECADGVAAFEVALQARLAVVVTEVGKVGDGCGWTLIDRLRANAITARIPILALVSREIIHDQGRALDAGADRCFVIPLAPADFVAAVSELVNTGSHVPSGGR